MTQHLEVSVPLCLLTVCVLTLECKLCEHRLSPFLTPAPGMVSGAQHGTDFTPPPHSAYMSALAFVMLYHLFEWLFLRKVSKGKERYIKTWE